MLRSSRNDCSAFLPKPMPGSNTMRIEIESCALPLGEALLEPALDCGGRDPRSAGSVRVLSAGTPRLCIATNSAPLVAASSIIAGVVSPLTSLMMSAPSASARRAVSTW